MLGIGVFVRAHPNSLKDLIGQLYSFKLLYDVLKELLPFTFTSNMTNKIKHFSCAYLPYTYLT